MKSDGLFTFRYIYYYYMHFVLGFLRLGFACIAFSWTHCALLMTITGSNKSCWAQNTSKSLI